MELVINSSKLNEASEQENPFEGPSDFLNSNYKTVVKQSINNASSKSIFGLRRRIKNSRYNFVSGMEVALKVSVFLVAIIAIFN